MGPAWAGWVRNSNFPRRYCFVAHGDECGWPLPFCFCTIPQFTFKKIKFHSIDLGKIKTCALATYLLHGRSPSSTIDGERDLWSLSANVLSVISSEVRASVTVTWKWHWGEILGVDGEDVVGSLELEDTTVPFSADGCLIWNTNAWRVAERAPSWPTERSSWGAAVRMYF